MGNSRGDLMDDLERVIRPIVEGQIRGFLKEHPSIVEAVDWYKPRQDKSATLVNSLAKRIVRDLACPTTRARLAAALLEFSADPQPVFDRGTATAVEGGRLGISTEPTADRSDCR